MAYKIKYYFGDQITLTPMPVIPTWQTRTYPGANGESALNMGSGGKIIMVSGTYKVKADFYAEGVSKLYRDEINPMAEKFEELSDWEYDDLYFKSCILLDVKIEKPYRAGSYVKCRVHATIKQLDNS